MGNVEDWLIRLALLIENQIFDLKIWRFAVLYNMAKSVGRFPGIYNTSTWTCDKLNSPNEIENTFPILYSSLRYMVI